MLKEALQYILEGMRPETHDLCGRAYVITPSGAQEVTETPIVPATLQLHSLDSIVKMIRTEAIHLADANTPALFVNIPSPTNVTCFSQPDFTQRCVRAVFYSAGATDVPGWDAKVTLGFEEAQIALRTRFQETGDSLYAMKLVNDISLGAKVIYNDNGVANHRHHEERCLPADQRGNPPHRQAPSLPHLPGGRAAGEHLPHPHQ